MVSLCQPASLYVFVPYVISRFMCFFCTVCQDVIGNLMTFMCGELPQMKSLLLITKHMLEIIPKRIWLVCAESQHENLLNYS